MEVKMEIKKINENEIEITTERKQTLSKERILKQKEFLELKLTEIKKQLDYFNEK